SHPSRGGSAPLGHWSCIVEFFGLLARRRYLSITITRTSAMRFLSALDLDGWQKWHKHILVVVWMIDDLHVLVLCSSRRRPKDISGDYDGCNACGNPKRVHHCGRCLLLP